MLCNPHNPVGRVWSAEELQRLGEICLAYHVIILDDEIHCDFIYPGFHFTSFFTLDKKFHKNLVVFTSPANLQRGWFQPSNIII